MEDKTSIVAEPTLVAEEYREAMSQFMKEVQNKCHDVHADYHLITTNQDYEEIIHDSIDSVRERVLEDIRRDGNPARAVIEGVDDTWEISILKFSFEMIQRSHDINAFDFKRRGLI